MVPMLGMDHAAALDILPMRQTAADGELDPRSLGFGIGPSRWRASPFPSRFRPAQFRQVLLDALNRQALTDHAGRGDDH